jgi:hypothetical protein
VGVASPRARRTAAHRATIAYAAYIGLLHLAREVPERLADERTIVLELLQTLTDSSPRERARCASSRPPASHSLNDQKLELAASFRCTTVQDAE